MKKLKPGIPSFILFAAAITVIAGCQTFVSNFGSGSKQKPKQGAEKRAERSVNTDIGKDDGSLCVETAKTMAEAGHAREAILLYEKAETLDQGKKFDFELASLYASRGEYDKAIQRYELAIEKQSDPELWNNYVWTLMEADKLVDAARKTNRALELFPNDPSLTSTLAVIEYRRGNRESSFRFFEKVLGPSAAYHNLAVLDIEAGNFNDAMASLEQSIQLAEKRNPTSIELLNQLKKNVNP